MKIRWIVLCLFVAPLVFAQAPESKIRKSIVDTALSFKGVPYVYGAASPSAFDCSGFVRYVYDKAVGIMLPRTSKALFAEGAPIKASQAKPGDVLVFDTVGGAPSHVAIVVDKESMIHAASSGPRTGVIVSPMDDRYFAPRLIGARVFVGVSAVEAPKSDDEGPKIAAAAKPASDKATPAKPAAAPKSSAGKEPAKGPAAAKSAAGKAPEKSADAKPPVPVKSVPAAKADQDDEPVVSTIGFSISNEPVVFTDKIPAAVGTAVQFAVTNDTGKDGVFEILFYKMDKDPSLVKTIRRDRIKIKAGGMTETDPILFSESGQYKLILKTHDNLKRVERVWRVVAVK